MLYLGDTEGKLQATRASNSMLESQQKKKGREVSRKVSPCHHNWPGGIPANCALWISACFCLAAQDATVQILYRCPRGQCAALAWAVAPSHSPSPVESCSVARVR